MTVEMSILVAAPIDRVFEHIADPALIAKRSPELVSWEWIGEPGLRAGAGVAFIKDMDGGRFEHSSALVRYEPPAYLESRTAARRIDQSKSAGKVTLQPSRFEVHEIWRLSPGEGGVSVSIEFSLALPGAWKPFKRMFERGLGPSLLSALEDIKRAAEADPGT